MPDDLWGVNNNLTRSVLAPIAASVLLFSLGACGSDDDASTNTGAPTTHDMATATTDMAGEMAGSEVTVGDITVTDSWIRQPAEGQTTSAAYATITNNGDVDLALTEAAVNVDATVELHETIMDADGKMEMKARPDGFVIPAGGMFELEPGGAHVMMMDVDPATITGSILLTLTFDDGTVVEIPAAVRATPAGDMDGHMTGTTMGG